MENLNSTKELQEESFLSKKLERRSFLRFAGAGAAGMALVASGCIKDPAMPNMNGEGIYIGSGDIAILNYAYALEQLEAAFYTEVVAKASMNNLSTLEKTYMQDIRDHEIAHREFFKAALGSNAIPSLTVDFSSIDFTKRDGANGILAVAAAFENLGVAAYNGAGYLIKDTNYLIIAGQIVSVEARHAALINDLISNGTFAKDTDANGLDKEKTASEVLAIAGTYIKDKLNVKDFPTA